MELASAVGPPRPRAAGAFSPASRLSVSSSLLHTPFPPPLFDSAMLTAGHMPQKVAQM
jgi:hypothetical protein